MGYWIISGDATKFVMRRDSRVDANQTEIVSALRQIAAVPTV